MNSKGTFKGFVNSLSNDYRRIANVPFMSLQTFIVWFFAWSSAMKVDFREQCDWCGDKPNILACDGTKIGIGFKQLFVRPNETLDQQSTNQTKNRRYDRTFIANRTGKYIFVVNI